MSPAAGAQKLGLVVRVSKVKGREGERFISPEEQIADATVRATQAGYGVKVFMADAQGQGVSGATPYESRPGMSAALKEVRAGKLAGIVVAYQDRLVRKDRNGGVSLSEMQKLAKSEGFVLLIGDNSNAEVIDSKQELPTGFAAAGSDVRELADQWVREEAAKKWHKAKVNAVMRGVHVGPVPAGYLKDDDGRLKEHRKYGPKVREAFKARAAGRGWQAVCDALQGVPTSRGATTWSHKAAEKFTRNRTYLGRTCITLDGVEYVAKDGHEHEALVSGSDFRKCASFKQTREAYVRDERKAPLLARFLRCATCGHALTRDTARKGGYETYRCKNTGACAAKVSIGLKPTEHFLLRELAERAVERATVTLAKEKPGSGIDHDAAVSDAEAARAEVEDAHAAGELSPLAYGKALDAGTAALEAAEAAREADGGGPLDVLGRKKLDVPGFALIFSAMNRDDQRGLIGYMLESATVKRQTFKGQPVHERLVVEWKEAA